VAGKHILLQHIASMVPVVVLGVALGA